MLSEQETTVFRRNKSFSCKSALFSILVPGHESWATIQNIYVSSAYHRKRIFSESSFQSNGHIA